MSPNLSLKIQKIKKISIMDALLGIFLPGSDIHRGNRRSKRALQGNRQTRGSNKRDRGYEQATEEKCMWPSEHKIYTKHAFKRVYMQ